MGVPVVLARGGTEAISIVLESRRIERGISVAELSRRVGMNYDVLCRCLKGASMPKGDQLICLCKELELDLADFDEGAAAEVRS